MNKNLFGLFVLSILVTISAAQDAQCNEKHPIVFFPGIMGTVLDATGNFDANSGIPKECPKQFNDQLMWIDIHEVINYKCLSYYFSSNYNPSKKAWERVPGIEFIVPKWGTTYACDVLAPGALTAKLIPYFHNMIQKFESLGYTDGVDLIGGGFDWKELPSQDWLNKMKDLIEKAVEKSGSKAVIIGHSMGAPYSYYFLMEMGDAWVQKNVYMYIPMAPAYMGAVKALYMMLEGLDETLPIGGKYFAPLMRHMPSLWFLLPWKDAFKGMVLATSPSKSYSFDQLEELLNDGNASYVEGKLSSSMGVFYNKFKNYDSFPKVPIRAFIGTDVDTILSIKFKEDIKPHDPDGYWESSTVVKGNGDGTVPLCSANYVFDKWKNAGADIKVFSYSKMEHLGIIRDSGVIQDVVNLIC